MWRYMNVSPPPQKKAKTSEERRLVQNTYDAEKRQRTFQKKWCEEYKWLHHDPEKNIMKCFVCVELDSQGPFVSGCSNFKLCTVKEHENSKVHRDNVHKYNAKKEAPGSSKAVAAVGLLNKAAFTRLSMLFRNAHFIAKHGRPYTDYIKLCELDKAKGVDIGNTYLTDKYCQKFVRNIADTLRAKQDDTFQTCPFFTVISDGSTDVSSREAEILYVRTSSECKVKTYFLGIRNVERGDSSTISNAIISMLRERYNDEWISKLIAVGTDGAAVMVGKKSGVVQKLREYTNNQHIYGIHCSAHRLELAYKDVMKKHKMTEKCESLLLNLYLFYKYSPLNRSNLQKSFESLGLKMKVPTRVGGTRWLPHTKRAISNILHGRNAIVQHLEQLQSPTDQASKKESAAKARNFLKALRDKNILHWLHFLMDVVCCLSTLSEAIQEADCTLGEVWNEMESALSTLESYKTSNRIGKDLNWQSLHQSYGPKFPNFMLFVNFLLTIPSSSVDAERGFSRMKLVKNDWRSRLSDYNLSDLLLISLHSPPVGEYEPEEDVRAWSEGGLRAKRPTFNEKERKPMEKVCMDATADDINIFGLADTLDGAGEEQDDDDTDNDLYDREKDLALLQNKAYRHFLNIMN